MIYDAAGALKPIFITPFYTAYGYLFDLGRLCIFRPGPNHSFIRVRGRTTYLLFPTTRSLIFEQANLRTYMWVVFLQIRVGCMWGCSKTIDGAFYDASFIVCCAQQRNDKNPIQITSMTLHQLVPEMRC
jgi:hypothetical protein